MILDAQNLFSDAQAVTASAASTNLIDLRATNQDPGVGENLYVVSLVDVAFTDAGNDSTVTVTLETDTADTFGSATTVQTIGTFAALSAGTVLIARLQPGITERYLRAYYTLANGNLTTGSITTFLCHNVDKYRAYPKSSGSSIDLT